MVLLSNNQRRADFRSMLLDEIELKLLDNRHHGFFLNQLHACFDLGRVNFDENLKVFRFKKVLCYRSRSTRHKVICTIKIALQSSTY